MLFNSLIKKKYKFNIKLKKQENSIMYVNEYTKYNIIINKKLNNKSFLNIRGY